MRKKTVEILVSVLMLIAIVGGGIWFYLIERNDQISPLQIVKTASPKSEINQASSSVSDSVESTNSVPTYQWMQRLAPPTDSVFEALMVEGADGLKTVLSEKVALAAWVAFQNHRCHSSKFAVYQRNEKPEKLVVSECYRVITPATANTAEDIEIEYPVVLVAKGDSILEVSNLNEFGFMYQSGSINAVTDMNKNGCLELWLDGNICECGEGEEPCECDGTSVVENRDGKLYEYKP